MSDNTVNTRHSLTGKVQRMTADQAAVFPDYLEIVADDAKPYEPGLFRPGKVGEFSNPEPPTDAEVAAQAELDAVLEDSSPNSKAAREAKANVKAAEADAEAARAAAEAQSATNQGEADAAPETAGGTE